MNLARVTCHMVDFRNSAVGLCADCAHARVVVSAKGSRFWLCTAASSNPGMPRYPRLPVLRCPVFQPGTPMRPASDRPGPGGGPTPEDR